MPGGCEEERGFAVCEKGGMGAFVDARGGAADASEGAEATFDALAEGSASGGAADGKGRGWVVTTGIPKDAASPAVVGG